MVILWQYSAILCISISSAHIGAKNPMCRFGAWTDGNPGDEVRGSGHLAIGCVKAI